MITEYIHGYPFYTVQAPNSLVDKLLDNIQQLTYQKIAPSYKNGLGPHYAYPSDKINADIFDSAQLYTFLNSQLEIIYKKHFIYANKHKICDLWITKSTFGASSNPHSHQHSIFSGLLYLQDSKTSTSFFFEDPFYKVWTHFTDCNVENLSYKSESIKGKLLIWPSVIPHKIDYHKEKGTRYTIAFNSFWDEIVSNKPTEILHIKTSSAQSINLPD